jgi:hypothetical protein
LRGAIPVPGNRRHGERSVISAENDSAKIRMFVPINQRRRRRDHRKGHAHFPRGPLLVNGG